MKRSWTRGEKALFLAPLLFVAGALALNVGPNALRRAMGWPQSWSAAGATSIRSMALSGDGKVLAAGGMIETPKGWKRGSGAVQLWDTLTGQPISTFPPIYTRERTGFTNGFDIYALTLSPNAKQIGFSRAVMNSWTLHDVATKSALWSFPKFVEFADFARDGKCIALSTSRDIFIVDSRTGRVKTKWRRSGDANSNDVALSPDGTLIASIGPYKTKDPIELHQVADGKLVRQIRNQWTGSSLTASVHFSPDGKWLLVAGSVGSFSSTEEFNLFAPVRCYQVSTGQLQWEVKCGSLGGTDGKSSSFCDAVFSPDGLSIAAYQYLTGKIFLLDGATGAVKKVLDIGRSRPSSFFVPPGIRFSPDGKRLYARGKDAVLVLDLK